MGRYHMGQVRGVGITQVVKDSPAEKAGLKKDDVILRLDGENITSVRKLNRLISEIAPDQSVRSRSAVAVQSRNLPRLLASEIISAWRRLTFCRVGHC